ncbi:hypothetical protein D3C73_866610 [compost metagenome]
MRLQGLQLEHGPAQAAELLLQQGGIHRTLLRGFQQQLRIHTDGDVLLNVRPPGGQRLAGAPLDLHLHREDPIGLLGFIGLAQRLIQRRVIGLPDAVADMQAAQVYVVAARNNVNDPPFSGLALELHAFAAQIVDAAAFFLLRRIAGIKYNAVPALQRSMNTAYDTIAQNLFDGPHIDSPAFRESAVNQLFIIRPFEEPVREATGEALLQLADIFLRGRRPVPVKIPVNRLTVLTNHVSYIFRTFEAAFNFEGSYPRLDQLRHQVNRRQILRGQEIGDIAHRLDFTIHHQVIRQTAGLRTFPPVGGASAPHFRGQTLA